MQDKPQPKRPGRNEPCPCGSGKKHKRCCLKPSVTPTYDERVQEELDLINTANSCDVPTSPLTPAKRRTLGRRMPIGTSVILAAALMAGSYSPSRK